MAAFTRLAAVLVGLANLVVLDGSNGVVTAFQSGNVGWNGALPPVLAAGLVTSGIILRWLRPVALAEKFRDRYAFLVIVVCPGGTLMVFCSLPHLPSTERWFPGHRRYSI